MLKGHVFKQQAFGNQIFALFINTFLNGKNGVSNTYKNSMEVTYSESTLTINSGAVCIQGRFLEEDTSTPISAGTDTAYCKLVIEIDLDKENTESDFVQGAYKIVKSTTTYPALTQTDIVKNNEGVYQYELAQFRTTASGITDFVDKRTYLDFNSIYAEIEDMFTELEAEKQAEYTAMLQQLQQELASVEDGSAYVLKNNFAVMNFQVGTEANSSANIEKDPMKCTKTYVELDMPSGFTYNNCVVVSFLVSSNQVTSNYGWNNYLDSSDALRGTVPFSISLGFEENQVIKNKIRVGVGWLGTEQGTYYCKLVLMKIS